MGKPRTFSFIDVFSGCGGLSLGLFQAGWKGLFAIDADRYAFETLKHNLIADGCYSFDWPSWLPQEPMDIKGFIEEYRSQLKSLTGTVDLIVGGPPCQGFSMAGRRKKNDPRNQLFRHYLKLVDLLRPPLLLFENVRGVTIVHGKKHQKKQRTPGRPPTPFSTKIQQKLEMRGYQVFPLHVRAMDFGVPQKRPRYIMLAFHKSMIADLANFNPFEALDATRMKFLESKGLPLDKPVGVRDAISDLEVFGKNLIPCEDSAGFVQPVYGVPTTSFQKLLHGSMNGTPPNSMRLAKHRDDIRERFAKIIQTCRPGIGLSSKEREIFGIKKTRIVTLNPDSPSPTLTSLPDDVIHYSEPRILSVREYARLQSFPDWFAFKGKYTTGGTKRIKECPRYTQVANAVPPFLAEFLGHFLLKVGNELLK